MTSSAVPVDWHVHIHRPDAIGAALDGAAAAFASLRPGAEGLLGVLMLAELPGQSVFDELDATRRPMGGWEFRRTAEPVSLLACRGRAQLAIVAGFQVVSAERLEVLALGTRVRPDSGLTADRLLDWIAAQGAIAVLPWGVGKWLGARGGLIRTLIERRQPGVVALGDNAGRPALWPRPKAFAAAERRGIAVLPGSDTLPGARSTAGRVGGLVPDLSDVDHPTQALRRVVADPQRVLPPYGALASPADFVRAQAMLRLRRLLRTRSG